jgi:hypothetical protein
VLRAGFIFVAWAGLFAALPAGLFMDLCSPSTSGSVLIWILAVILPLSLLVYQVVFQASNHRAGRVVFDVKSASVAPIAITEAVEILNPQRDDVLFHRPGYAASVRHYWGSALFSLHEVCFVKNRFLCIAKLCTFLQSFISQPCEPLIGLLEGVVTPEYPPHFRKAQCGRFPEIGIANMAIQPVVGRPNLCGIHLGGMNVWLLISHEKVLGFIQRSTGQISLPDSDKSISKHQPGSNLYPEKLPIAGGLILCALGITLLFKVLNYVYLDTGFNVNMAVGGCFLALAIFVVGGLLVLVNIFP